MGAFGVRGLARIAVITGGLLVAASFVLPFRFDNAPLSWFLWSIGGVDFAEAPGESLVFMAAAGVIALPYAWAAALAFVHVRASWIEKQHAPCTCAVLYTIGMVLAVVVAVAAFVTRDDFIPRTAQVAVAVVASTLASAMTAASAVPRPKRRFGWTALVGSTTLLLLSVAGAIGLCGLSALAWGYLLGAVGAVLMLVAAVGEMRKH